MDNYDFMRLIFTGLSGLALAIVAIELVLSVTWNRFYFTAGIPIFVHNVSAEPKRFAPPTTKEMEAYFTASFAGPSLEFKELSPNEYGFRERFFEFRLFGFRSTPVMHGLLVYDYAQSQVIVKGMPNWTIFVFSLFWLSGILNFGLFSAISWLSVGLFLLVITMLYTIQVSKFRKVASVATSLWSAKP